MSALATIPTPAVLAGTHPRPSAFDGVHARPVERTRQQIAVAVRNMGIGLTDARRRGGKRK